MSNSRVFIGYDPKEKFITPPFRSTIRSTFVPPNGVVISIPPYPNIVGTLPPAPPPVPPEPPEPPEPPVPVPFTPIEYVMDLENLELGCLPIDNNIFTPRYDANLCTWEVKEIDGERVLHYERDPNPSNVSSLKALSINIFDSQPSSEHMTGLIKVRTYTSVTSSERKRSDIGIMFRGSGTTSQPKLVGGRVTGGAETRTLIQDVKKLTAFCYAERINPSSAPGGPFFYSELQYVPLRDNVTFKDGEWNFIRFEVNQEVFKYKVWHAESIEPANWQAINIVNNVKGFGWAGIVSLSNDSHDIGYMEFRTIPPNEKKTYIHTSFSDYSGNANNFRGFWDAYNVDIIKRPPIRKFGSATQEIPIPLGTSLLRHSRSLGIVLRSSNAWSAEFDEPATGDTREEVLILLNANANDGIGVGFRFQPGSRTVQSIQQPELSGYGTLFMYLRGMRTNPGLFEVRSYTFTANGLVLSYPVFLDHRYRETFIWLRLRFIETSTTSTLQFKVWGVGGVEPVNFLSAQKDNLVPYVPTSGFPCIVGTVGGQGNISYINYFAYAKGDQVPTELDKVAIVIDRDLFPTYRGQYRKFFLPVPEEEEEDE